MTPLGQHGNVGSDGNIVDERSLDEALLERLRAAVPGPDSRADDFDPEEHLALTLALLAGARLH